MKSRKERLEFARSRPLPAFGVLLKWVIDLLGLAELECYQLESLPSTEKDLLHAAIDELISSSFKNVAAGTIVKEETKRRVCSAISTCLRNVPELPFSPIPTEELANSVRAIWLRYEQISGLLTSLIEGHDFVQNAIFRQATLELAVRAGAICAQLNDTSFREDVPIWSKHKELQRHLRDLTKMAAGSRDKLAAQLGRSNSEVDGWIYEMDSPAPADLRKWEALLASGSTNLAHSKHCHYLWRLYIGLRLWKSVRTLIPEPLENELLRAYCRIKRRVCAFFSLDQKTEDAHKQHHLAFLVLTGRVTTADLLASLTAGETDLLWVRHAEAASRIEGYQTNGILGLCEFYSNAGFGFDEGAKHSGIRLNESLDDFLRGCMHKAGKSNDPWGEWLGLCDDARRHEENGDIEGAIKCIEKLVRMNPSSPATWNSLGRARFKQGRFGEAEECYRKSLQLGPEILDSRAGLALVLSQSGRAEEALNELGQSDKNQKQRPEWVYAHGVALLKSGKTAHAKQELQKCAAMGFKLSACYRQLGNVCEQLGEAAEARQFHKQAVELEGVQ